MIGYFADAALMLGLYMLAHNCLAFLIIKDPLRRLFLPGIIWAFNLVILSMIVQYWNAAEVIQVQKFVAVILIVATALTFYFVVAGGLAFFNSLINRKDI